MRNARGASQEINIARPKGLLPQHMRIAQLAANTSGVLPGTIKDWPPHIQDGIYEALARVTHRARKDFTIVMSRSDRDPDTGPYVHVVAVAMEVVQ